ncbi:MAG: hypothetical protein N2109_08260 [Fimbriimonadales bacterium]|nr:hypothetical protein [Fimbriimonadales bacterium]
MNRIPREIDQLMWALAEQPDPAALEEFQRRHPAYVGELGRRIAMVRSLKGCQPLGQAPPPFQPRQVAEPRPRWVLAAAFGSVLVALCFASYLAANWYLGRSVPPAEPRVEQPAVAPPRLPEVVYAPPRRFEAPQPALPTSETELLPPLSVRLRDVPLSVALRAIAEQAGLRVTLAPGFERLDATVDVDLAETKPMDAFAILGRRYGFTAFYQGNREVLVIPAVPSQESEPAGSPAPSEPSAGGPQSLNDLRRTEPLGGS